MAYNFKSSGFKLSDRIINNPDDDPKIRQIGIKTPLEFSKKSNQQLFHMNEDPLAQVKDNLRNLILTEKGERLGRPDFGCGIKKYLFDLTSIPNYESIIIQEISQQVEKYFPFILIKNIEILDYAKAENYEELKERGGLASILLRLTYDIQKIGAQDQKIEIIIFAGG